MLILFKLKETIDKVPEVIKEVKQSALNFFGFVIVVTSLLLFGIVGVCAYSKLPEIWNLSIVVILLLLMCYMILRTFNSAIKNPRPFVYNQNAFITVMREKLTDSESERVYYTDQLIGENTKAPQQIAEKNQTEEAE